MTEEQTVGASRTRRLDAAQYAWFERMVAKRLEDSNRVESRHNLIGGILMGAAILTAVLALIGGMVWNGEHTRQSELRRETVCVQHGGIWTHDDCIIVRQSGG